MTRSSNVLELRDPTPLKHFSTERAKRARKGKKNIANFKSKIAPVAKEGREMKTKKTRGIVKMKSGAASYLCPNMAPTDKRDETRPAGQARSLHLRL